MAYDIFAFPMRAGEPDRRDPSAVEAVFERYNVDRPDGDSYYRAFFGDGSHLTLIVSGMNEPEGLDYISFEIRAFSPYIARFIFDIAYHTDTLVIPTSTESMVILVHDGQIDDVPAEMKNDPTWHMVRVHDGDEMQRALFGGWKDWSAYAAQVIGRPPSAQ